MKVICIVLNRTSLLYAAGTKFHRYLISFFDTWSDRTDATRPYVARPQVDYVCALAAARARRFGERCQRRGISDAAGEDHCANASRYRSRCDLPPPRRAIRPIGGGGRAPVLTRGGGGGPLPPRPAVTAAPDGYTIFMPATSIFVSMPELYRDLPFDVSRDLVPIGFVGEQPLAIAVRPSLGVNSLQELIAFSREQPGKLNLATIMPVGSLPNLTGELFRARSGAQITSIPYPGDAEAMSDLRSRRVQ